MRKLTLFIATLLLTVAKTVAFEGSNPEHLYFITNGNNVKVGKNAVNSNEAGCFAFYAVEGVDKAYYIYSLDEKKWFDYEMKASYGGTKNFVKLSEEKGNYFYIESCANNAGFYQIRPYKNTGVASIYLNYFQGVDGSSTIGLWTADGAADAGSRWNFIEAECVYEIDGLSNDKVYNLTTTRGWLIYNESNANQVSSTASYKNFTTGKDVEACQWAIYKSEKTDQYYLYNIGAGKFVGKNSDEAGRFPFVATVTNDIQVVKSTTGTSYALVFSTDTYGAINHFNHTAAPGVANWKGNANEGGLRALGDAGSAHRVVEVGTISNETLATITELVAVYETLPKLDEAIAAAEGKAAWVGEAVGLYSYTGDYAAELQSIKDFREAIDENTILTAVQEKIESLTAMSGSLTLNTPQTGKYYRLKNAVSNRYMSANSEGNGVVVIDNGAEAASTIFYLEEGNVFRSYTRNLYLDCGNKILSSEKKTGLFAVAFNNNPTANTITYKNNNYWVFGDRGDGVSIDRGSNSNLAGYNWIIEEVTELPVAKIGETAYYTFAEALEATKTMTGDVTVEIYDKVTFNQPLIGNYTSINFVGKDTDAEMYLDVQGYTTATGKKVSFTDLKLSKSEGGFIANAGFMNVAFGIYDVVEVTYTNCTFENGACASSGKVTFNDCTFKKSWDKYGLWAYGNVDVTVQGSTFADYRGIKMYAENGADASVEKANLTVKNTNFSAVDNKPAIVLTYGESVVLEGNTYSSTGTFELDLDGKPNGVAVTSDDAPVCVNDNGACGVLVDGKIYTTVAQAAEVATSGSTVTLLHNSTETVELAEGVVLDKNGFEAVGVTVYVKPPVAKIGDTPYYSLAEALADAKTKNLSEVVITIIGENTAATADKFNLYQASVFNKVTFKQENGNKPYYFEELYTGSRTDNGQFVFDGVNLVVTGQGQYIFEGNVVLSNNSLIKSTAEANCFVYNAEVTVEAGSKIDGVIEDIRGGSLIIDGGKTDGTYCETPGLRDAILVVNWANSNLVLRNGAYVNINAANEIGRLTVTGTLDVTNSKLDSYQWIEVNGSMKLNAGSLITTQQVKGAGNITIDAKGMVAGDVNNFKANLSQFTGTLEVINNDKLEAQIVDGKIVLAAKPVAKIGEQGYATLNEAFAAATEGQTINMLDDATPALTSQRAITKAAVIDLGGKTLTLTEDDLYFGTTTFKNGTIVVDPSVKPSTAVFWMFANQTLTFDAVKVVATGVTGTYLIGLDGNNSDLNLLNGSEIFVENTTALDLDIICVNASTGNDIMVKDSKVNVKNLDGRVFFRGNYTVKDSEVNLAGITKAGFRIEAGQTLSIEGTSKVNIEGEPRDGGIHLTDKTAVYTKAATATVNATVNEPAKGSNSPAYVGKDANGNVRVWGEGGGNAKESFELKLYAGETLIATSKLNNIGGIINGNVFVTWNFFYPESNDEYWTTTWEEGHPNSVDQPTKLELIIDGTVVATTNAMMCGPDNLNPVKWEELGGVKYICTGLKGEGTEANPYLINKVEELLWFQAKVDEQAADGSTQYAGKYIKLTADIDLAGINWNPIGSMTGDHGSFKGVFDGGNHTISNLNIEQAGNGLGLFAYTSGNAVIKNLKLNNVTVKSTNNSNYVGGVVGNAYASTKIENVHVTGDVLISGRGYIGGIAGHGYVVMDNVSVVANEGGLITSTFWCAGGVLGYAGEGTTNITNAHVEGLTVTSAAGGLGAIVGMAEDNNGTQPISGSNLSAKNVAIETYVGDYGTSYADYALGYLYGGNETSKLTGDLVVENVTVETSSGVAPTIVDAVATVGDAVYFDFAAAMAYAKAGETITLLRDVEASEVILVGKSLTINGNDHKVTSSATRVFRVTTSDTEVTLNNVNMVSTAFSSYTSDIRGISIDGPSSNVKLTLNNCSVDFDPESGSDWAYAVNMSAGCEGHTLTINGGTYEGANVINIWGNNHKITIDGATLNNLYNAPQNNYFGQCVRFEGTGCETTIKNSVFNGVHAVVVGEKTPDANTVAQENNTDNTKTYDVKAGTKYYYTLAEAFAAVEDNATIEVRRDIEETETAVNTKNVVLDLKGKTVTMVYTAKATKNHTMISNSGNLTIQSSVEGGKLSYTYAGENLGTTYSANTVTSNPGSVLTVKSGTIENLTFDSGIIAYAIDGLTNGGAGDVTVNIEGGVITSKRQAVRIFANSTTNTGALNISGGDFTGRVIVQNASAKANKAALNITGGTFNANEYKSDVLYVGGSSSATIDINATVSGGKFNGEITETNVEGFISGGTFANPVAAQFCAEGFMPNKNTDGTYGVVEASDMVATTNGFGYATLAEAIKACVAGDNTIELLADCAEKVTITQVNGTNITINGNGKTYTGTITVKGDKVANNLYNTETLTFKNINFAPAYNTYAITAEKNTYVRNITVDGCTFKGNNDVYGIRVRNGYNYTVKNTTVEGVYTFFNASEALNGLTVENVTVKCASVAFSGAYGYGNASFKNVTVESGNNGIKVNNPNSSALTFENCSITAKAPVTFYENVGVTSALTAEFNGTNTMVVSEGGTYWFNIVEAAATDATFKAIVNDANLDMCNTAFAASVGNVYYSNLTTAINEAADGATVVIARDIELDAASCVTNSDGYSVFVNVAGKALTIDLNGQAVTANLSADQFASAKSSLLMAVFSVDTDGILTLNDSKGTGKVAVTANDASVYSLISNYDKTAKLTINGGSYELDKARAKSSLIHSDPSEAVVVNGGNFYLGNVNTGANGSPWIFNVNGNNTGHVIVKGGTFNYDINHQYWAFEVHVDNTSALKNNGDGTWTVVSAVAYVAEENNGYTRETGYATLEEAVASKYGNEVTMLLDVELSETVTVPAGKEVVLDLNGKTISANIAEQLTKSFAAIQNRGTLTIKDASAEEEGKISVSYAGNSFGYGVGLYTISNEGGVLNIEGGTIENTTTVSGSMYDAIDNNSTLGETVLNISGGEVVCGQYIGVRQFANNTTYDNIVNVTGGKVVGGNTSIWMQNPNSNANKATVSISGADYENGNYPVIEGRLLAGESTGFNFNVTGGLFNTDVNAFCAESYASYNFGNDTWGVEYLILGELTIVDGEYDEFENQNAKTVRTLTYERTLNTGWNALYVPFEIPVDVLTALGYEAAFFYDVHFEVLEGGEINPESAPDVHLIKIKEGTLKANFPYVIRASQNADPNMSLVLNDVTLYSTAASEMNSVEAGSTINRFIFAGTYATATREQLTGDTDIPCYAITPRGTFQKMSATAKLTPFRVFMYIVAKDGSPVILNDVAAESIQMRVIGEENEDGSTIIYDVVNDVQTVDYIYDLQGRRVLEPQKGNLYIINGKKVIF